MTDVHQYEPNQPRYQISVTQVAWRGVYGFSDDRWRWVVGYYVPTATINGHVQWERKDDETGVAFSQEEGVSQAEKWIALHVKRQDAADNAYQKTLTAKQAAKL